MTNASTQRKYVDLYHQTQKQKLSFSLLVVLSMVSGSWDQIADASTDHKMAADDNFLDAPFLSQTKFLSPLCPSVT